MNLVNCGTEKNSIAEPSGYKAKIGVGKIFWCLPSLTLNILTDGGNLQKCGKQNFSDMCNW